MVFEPENRWEWVKMRFTDPELAVIFTQSTCKATRAHAEHGEIGWAAGWANSHVPHPAHHSGPTDKL